MNASEKKITRALGIRKLEALCAGLFATDGLKPSCLVYAAVPSQQYSTDTFSVGIGGAHTLGVKLERESTRRQRCDVVVAAARNVARGEAGAGPKWVGLGKESSEYEGTAYHIIVPRTPGVAERSIIRASPEALAQLPMPTQSRGTFHRTLMLGLPLVIYIQARLQPSDLKGQVLIGPSQWCIAVRDLQGAEIRAEFTDQTLGGVRMNGEKLFAAEFPAHVELGTITLSSEALLELRPGDQIEIANAIPLSGILRVGKEPWARVSIDQRAGELVLTVEELLGIEETFSKACR